LHNYDYKESIEHSSHVEILFFLLGLLDLLAGGGGGLDGLGPGNSCDGLVAHDEVVDVSTGHGGGEQAGPVSLDLIA